MVAKGKISQQIGLKKKEELLYLEGYADAVLHINKYYHLKEKEYL